MLNRGFLLLLNVLVLVHLEAFAWNFSAVGIPESVLIWRFTIWRNRAYLALPRWDKKSSKLPFTLLEAPWPEAGNPLQLGIAIPEVSPFPDDESHRQGVCQDLQSVTGLDSDQKGRLWVLDAPMHHPCEPKIVVFDLRRSEKVTETELHGISPRDLKCLAIDPVVGSRGFQAYVSDPGGDTIIVYSLGQRSWWRSKLSSSSVLNVPKPLITDLAISRKTSLMYLTGYPSDDLFSVDLEGVRNEGGSILSFKNESITRGDLSVSWVGSKMGASSGLICDLRGGLHYFIITEMASVRWDSRFKLEAQSHAVLLQSELVPCLTDYAFDSQKNVWGLINERYPLRKELTKNANGISNVQLRNNRRPAVAGVSWEIDTIDTIPSAEAEERISAMKLEHKVKVTAI